MALLRDLETDRLLLRLHTIDDLEELHRLLYADPEVAPAFAGKEYSLEESRERLSDKIWLNQHSGEQGWGYWSVFRREDRQLIGLVIFGHPERIYWTTDQYRESPYVPLFTEIGYAFGRAYWGQGYATEAARAVLEYAFRDLRVSRFEIPWYKGPRNPRSFNVYRRLGFDIEGGLDVKDHDVLLTMDNTTPDLPPLAAYEREASAAMIEHAFRKLKLPRIVNHLDAHDTRSFSLFESLGFTIDRNLHPHYGGFAATLAHPPAR